MKMGVAYPYRYIPTLVIMLTFAISLLAFGLKTEADEIPVSRFSSEGLAGWETKSFKGLTDYQLVKEGDRTVVRAFSQASASGLVKKIRFDPSRHRYLRWSWKIAQTVKNGDERTKAGDDYAARIYVVFPGRFFWQTRAINYIWANRLAKGDSIPNPFTSNAIMLAVESGNQRAGEWLSEERDLLADYRSLFASDPQEAEVVALMTDSDNSGGVAEAWYGEISLATVRAQIGR